MKDLITKILNEEITKKFTSDIIWLFKLLFSKREKIKTKKEMIKFFEDRLPLIGKSSSDSERFYYLYTLNYRQNGDFENIAPEDLIDERNFPKIKTTNISAGKFAYGKIPFEGSNLRGYWGKDGKGVEQYVIDSYGWYPILVYKNEKWYGTTERYSSSTSKHYNNMARGGVYDVIYLRQKDMERLVRGWTLDKIKDGRLDEFISDYADNIKNKSFYGFMYFVVNNTSQNLSFDCVITDIELRDDKIVVDANVNLKSKYRGIELTDEQKREVEKYFESMVYVRTKILSVEDVIINVNYVDL